MNTNTELPQVHASVHSSARREASRNSSRNTPSELPPAYSSLYGPTTVAATEEAPSYSSEDGGLLDGDYFNDETIRIGFIQKVLALKLLQTLGMTAVMAAFLMNSRDVIRFMNTGNNLTGFIVVSNVAFIFIYGLMVVCDNLRPKSPQRYFYLVAYPLSLSVFISIWTIYWHLLAPILVACVFYCIVVFALLMYSIFAMQTKLQFVTKYGILIAIGLQLMMYAITLTFLDISALFILCPTSIMILEYIYIIYNIEAMTSTSYWNIITPDDFVNGTIKLHIDYYNIIYNLTMPKFSHGSRRIMNRFDEFVDV